MSLQIFYTDSEGPKLHSSPPNNTSQRLTLQYLDEGGANFVFRILPEPPTQDLPPGIKGNLLRLRKDLPHVQSAIEQNAAFNEHFKPLFPPENLVQHQLIALDHGLASLVNKTLKEVDRPTHRIQDSIRPNENYGLLVTDMTPQPHETLLQLKPKWLAQSPSALPSAKRCRTCALRAFRATQKIRTATDAQESCPLALLSDDDAVRKQAVENITPDVQAQEFLMHDAQSLFRTLRSCQMALDPGGILGCQGEKAIVDYCKAMTLRDCTLFVKMSTSTGRIEARLADLDLKQPEKLTTWGNTEQRLIEEGWYTNTEADQIWSEERVCLLSR